MKADLHVHSTASDGTLPPDRIVDTAVSRGLDVLAIADHDTVDGIPSALAASSGTSLQLIPAVELSATSGSCDLHILGYFIDHEDSRLRLELESLRASRLERARTMVEGLRHGGHQVHLDDVLAMAQGGSVGRSHVARALAATGQASSVRDAFERLIGRGRPFYVAKDTKSPIDAIALIKGAGGVAVLAHPGITRADELMDVLIEAGLGGIEAYHADHTEQQREHYARIAADNGLLVTGGSDFHGPEAPNAGIGEVDVPEDAVDSLLSWSHARG